MKNDPASKDMIILKNLVYIYFLLHPNMTGRRIHTIWYRARVFRDYTCPDAELLHIWVEEFRKEAIESVKERKRQ